jgi:hypothetical protein
MEIFQDENFLAFARALGARLKKHTLNALVLDVMEYGFEDDLNIQLSQAGIKGNGRYSKYEQTHGIIGKYSPIYFGVIS